jgi:hypothetical protein
MSAEIIKSKIQQAYSYLQPHEIDTCFDMALSDYLSIKYPSENNRPNVNKVKYDFMTTQWIYKRMIDILDRVGGLSVTAYKENGINFTYGSSFIDSALVSEIMPKGSVPR